MQQERIESERLVHFKLSGHFLNYFLFHLFASPRKAYQRNGILLWPEQVARFTFHGHASGCLIVLNRTDKELILSQKVREKYAKNDRTYAAAHKSFPRFFRAQFDQRRTAKEEAKQVGHHIVANNHRNRHDAPNET